jgi:hypothetical protein
MTGREKEQAKILSDLMGATLCPSTRRLPSVVSPRRYFEHETVAKRRGDHYE